MDDVVHHSTLNAAQGSSAAIIEDLGWVLYVGGAVIFFLVFALLAYGIVGSPKKIDPRRWLVGAGLVFPIVTLAALLLYSIRVNGSLHTHSVEGALKIHVIAKQWWWDVRYRTNDREITLANELHIPLDREVEIILETNDVIHSFWLPSLAGKVDMIPGRTNRLVLKTSEAGVFRGQCAEYCGLQHALMAFYVVAESEAEFNAWLANQARPAAADTSLAASRSEVSSGAELFFRAGCAKCHVIRGTDAKGTLGPDLTHVGSRRSLAGGVLNNHIGTMAGWIAGAQDLKPGNAMPSTDVLSGEELRTLSAWLVGLK